MNDTEQKTHPKYTGKAMDRRYTGEAGDVTYNLKRCIHAEQCVKRLPQVFDSSRRPWIDANGAPADAIRQAMSACPSGALHFIPKDGAPDVPPPDNTIRLQAHGPLQFSGDLLIDGATVHIPDETRATLCRCGASQNKPFCDNTHRMIDFKATDPDGTGTDDQPVQTGHSGKLTINPTENGPIHIEGNFVLVDAAGVMVMTGDDTWLCRCGASQNKPFCDGSHNELGFKAE